MLAWEMLGIQFQSDLAIHNLVHKLLLEGCMKEKVLHMLVRELHSLVQGLLGYMQELEEIHIHPSLLHVHMQEQEQMKVQVLDDNFVWDLACKMALVLACNLAWACMMVWVCSGAGLLACMLMA